SGRQGDPGTTKFFLSLEDDLMRLFGSDRIASVMERMGIQEGEVIEHSLITKSVERAQKKVEENNFSIRKRLLEYDNVMNQQREIIYTRRNRALQGDRLKNDIMEYLHETVGEIVARYFEDVNAEKIKEEVLQNFLVEVKLEPEEFESLGENGITNRIIAAVKDFYVRKEEMLGVDLLARIERYSVLSVIDNRWKEHLREMDDLKEGIGLRAYGQKDPLLEYKSEAFTLFVELLNQIRNEIVSFCFKFFPQAPEELQERKRPARGRIIETKQNTEGIGLHGSGGDGQPVQVGKSQPIRVEERVGRNDPCPCGSGKKYKHCHG
ncbi:MAG: SEC-C metal-binding domain-containing protein, partial [Ignavibacteriaceae bacterium]